MVGAVRGIGLGPVYNHYSAKDGLAGSVRKTIEDIVHASYQGNTKRAAELSSRLRPSTLRIHVERIVPEVVKAEKRRPVHSSYDSKTLNHLRSLYKNIPPTYRQSVKSAIGSAKTRIQIGRVAEEKQRELNSMRRGYGGNSAVQKMYAPNPTREIKHLNIFSPSDSIKGYYNSRTKTRREPEPFDPLPMDLMLIPQKKELSYLTL